MNIDQTQSDGVVVLTINRPPVNALDIETVELLRDLAIGMVATPPTGLVLSGAGQCFSAGVDTRAFGAYTPTDRARMILAISAMITAIYALPCPVVTAVGGHALGGGFVLMLAGDVRLAVDDDKAKLGLTEAKAGVPFPAAPLELIGAELSPELMRRLTLTSQTLTPAELNEHGVIDELSSAQDLLSTAEARVRQLADQPAFGLVKQQIRGETLARLHAIVASGKDPLIDALARR